VALGPGAAPPGVALRAIAPRAEPLRAVALRAVALRAVALRAVVSAGPVPALAHREGSGRAHRAGPVSAGVKPLPRAARPTSPPARAGPMQAGPVRNTVGLPRVRTFRPGLAVEG
jgi:hypothetical protein